MNPYKTMSVCIYRVTSLGKEVTALYERWTNSSLNLFSVF